MEVQLTVLTLLETGYRQFHRSVHQLRQLGHYNPDDEISSESYDANGNVLYHRGMVYTYDSENHMTSATGNGKVVTMVYDAFGNRVSRR